LNEATRKRIGEREREREREREPEEIKKDAKKQLNVFFPATTIRIYI